MVSNFTKMIAGSLGLKEPWYIKGAEFLEGKQEVHVYVGIREGAAIALLESGENRQFGSGENRQNKSSENSQSSTVS